jgi:Glycosyltransferase
LCEQKGQLLLLEAARILAAQGVEFEIVLAGDGEMRAEIEALIARHGLQAQVRITGWISSEQVRAEILAAGPWCCRASPRVCRWSSWKPWLCAGQY